MLHKARTPTKLFGKDPLPIAGEYTGAVMLSGVRGFLKTNAPELLSDRDRNPNEPEGLAIADLSKAVPPRPPGFCIGCPERPIFAAMKLVEKELGVHHVAADIGCHLFSIMPPFNIGASTMGYGLGPASASAFNVPAKKRSIAVMGDGGFWHNGLTSSIGNAVFNKNDGVIVIVDNFYSAATGGQDILSSRASNRTKSTKHPIDEAVKGMGVKWLRHIDRTYDVGKMQATLREALTTEEKGPKVIVASSECMLNRQRREKPLVDKAIKGGERVVKPKFGVDEDICTGDHACMRLSGCPSLSVKSLDDPLRDDPVAHIDQNCVGCGNCGEVADAAVLCPSFYRTDIISNPNAWDRFLARMRGAVTGWLQRRRAAKRLGFA
jgi:indolepyruvate ferredoxin oxidoreductase alpha subunit